MQPRGLRKKIIYDHDGFLYNTYQNQCVGHHKPKSLEIYPLSLSLSPWTERLKCVRDVDTGVRDVDTGVRYLPGCWAPTHQTGIGFKRVKSDRPNDLHGCYSSYQVNRFKEFSLEWIK